MKKLKLEVVTPDRKVYEDDVDMIIFKATLGEMGILPDHLPLVTALQVAPMRIKKGEGEDVLAVHGGFIEVQNNRVIVLADSAETTEEIDISRAQAARERAQKRLHSKQERTDFKRAELALQRALIRLSLKNNK